MEAVPNLQASEQDLELEESGDSRWPQDGAPPKYHNERVCILKADWKEKKKEGRGDVKKGGMGGDGGDGMGEWGKRDG